MKIISGTAFTNNDNKVWNLLFKQFHTSMDIIRE